MKKSKLTPRQLEIFNFMERFFEENDQLPPSAYIAEYFGCAANAAYEVLKGIERKGLIEKNAVDKYRFSER